MRYRWVHIGQEFYYNIIHSVSVRSKIYMGFHFFFPACVEKWLESTGACVCVGGVNTSSPINFAILYERKNSLDRCNEICVQYIRVHTITLYKYSIIVGAKGMIYIYPDWNGLIFSGGCAHASISIALMMHTINVRSWQWVDSIAQESDTKSGILYCTQNTLVEKWPRSLLSARNG